MSEPQKIVLILGNGFDLDLGLKTSYKDFYESENCPKSYPSPLIDHLNKSWPNNLDKVRWYDLENELFNYCKSVQRPGPIQDVITIDERRFLKEVNPASIAFGIDNKYINVAKSLMSKGYLIRNYYGHYSFPYIEDVQESTYWRDKKAFNLIKEGLCKYIGSLSNGQSPEDSIALQVLFAVDCSRRANHFLDIYSFNYTSIPVDYGDGFMDCVHYVHGNCADGNIIIGTKDDSTIGEHYDFLQKSFDPFYKPPVLVADLLVADEVIFFGHSIGENDRQYFKAFFKQQTDYSHPNKKKITIFTLDDNSEVAIKRSLQKMTDNNLATLYGLNDLCIIKTASIKNSYGDFESFLKRFITDERLVKATLEKVIR